MFSDLKRLLGFSRVKKKEIPVRDENAGKNSRQIAVSQINAKTNAPGIVIGPSSEEGGKKSRTLKISDIDELYEAFDGKRIDEQIISANAVKNKKKIKPVHRKKKAPKKKSKKLDKNGFPLLSKSEDLLALFENPPEKISTRAEKVPVNMPGKDLGRHLVLKEKKPYKINLDKNGLPILDGKKDLAASFRTSSVRDDQPEDDFAALLELSLSGKSNEGILREKKDNMYPSRPMSLKQRLAKYPAPQRQLDLHGYTARKADDVTDTFIRNACRDGVYTLRIIVGKGLHSEGGAVLPDVVEDRVVFLKSIDVVLTFKWENGIKSKSGALLVYLVDRLSPLYHKHPGS